MDHKTIRTQNILAARINNLLMPKMGKVDLTLSTSNSCMQTLQNHVNLKSNKYLVQTKLKTIYLTILVKYKAITQLSRTGQIKQTNLKHKKIILKAKVKMIQVKIHK